MAEHQKEVRMEINLCETCRKEPECFAKGIFERERCEQYEPLSVEEQLERDESVNAIMVGPCPKCGGENTVDCENEPSIDDITVGACLDCKVHWCLECGYVLKDREEKCPHWGFCADCSAKNSYLSESEFMDKVCPTCEHYKNGCQLEDPSQCDKETQFLCPHEEDISNCPKLRRHLKQLD